MPETFVSLAAWLEPPVVAVLEDPPPPEPANESDVEPAIVEEDDGVTDAASDARRFRASVADAVACAVDDVLADIAGAVLARELELKPPELRRIVERALERVAPDHVVRVRVHPSDAARVCGESWTVVADDAVRPGDAMIDVRSGTIDVTLGARLAHVLESACA